MIGYDSTGVRRVYGQGDPDHVAYDEAREAAEAYIKLRPDTGRLLEWTFRPASDGAQLDG